MNSSENISDLLKAMIDSAPEISSITKNKQGYGYKYATLDSLIDMLRSVLPKHGIWFMQMPKREGDKSTLTTRIFHTSGQWIEETIEMTDTELQGKANDTQKVGASITYFRRYALSSIFAIAADEDVDGNMNAARQVKQGAVKQEQIQPKQRLDPLKYLNDDYTKRVSSGMKEEEILKYYADILKTDNVVKVKDLSQDDVRIIATEIYKANLACHA